MKQLALRTISKILNTLSVINLLGIKDYFTLTRALSSSEKLIQIQLKSFESPVWLRSGTSDADVFHQIYVYKHYNLPYKNIHPKIILDLGANIGLSARYFASRFPDAKIIALEPESSNFEMLCKNTEKYPNIFPVQAGVYHSDSWLNVESVYDQSHWAFSVRETANPDENSVKGRSVRSLMEEFKIEYIDILKVDIEGSEIELFSQNYEEWLSATDMVIIELHDGYRKGTSRTFFKAISQYPFSTSFHGENLVCVREEIA